MKKYSGGQYIDLTEEEEAEWETKRKELEENEQLFGGGYQLIADILLEEEGLIDPIEGLDYSAVRIEAMIPKTSASQRVLFTYNTSDSWKGFVCNTSTSADTKIVSEADHSQNYGYPKNFCMIPNSWLNTGNVTYGQNVIPERINSIRIGLGDSRNINLPAGTSIKIYAR